MPGTVEIGSVKWYAQVEQGVPEMAIAINETTNNQLYIDAMSVADDLVKLRHKCMVLAERLYFIGIPNDPVNGGEEPVTGFADAMELTKADIAAATALVIDTRDFVTSGRLQICAQILRNRPAM